MRGIFSKLKSVFAFQSDRDRYLKDAVDLADLEFRRRQYDRWEMDRARNFGGRHFF